MKASEFIPSKLHLVIFDIDDTLLHTTARIGVVVDGKVVKTLSNSEFNTYIRRPGESFDFSEFRDSMKFYRESMPIHAMIDKLKWYQNRTNTEVIFLTARADFDDRDTFLYTFTNLGIDMSRIHVRRAGNLSGPETTAEKKAIWVRRYLDTGKYSNVTMYDDNDENLRVFKGLRSEYPDISFSANHVAPTGRTKTVEQQ